MFQSMSDWVTFFATQCGASAALIGLLFVALSINLQRIILIPYLVDRLAEAVLVFLGLLVFSIFGLVPHQKVTTFGYETLATGLFIWGLVAASQVRGFRSRPSEAPLASYILRVAQLQAVTLSKMVPGVEITPVNPSGIFW